MSRLIGTPQRLQARPYPIACLLIVIALIAPLTSVARQRGQGRKGGAQPVPQQKEDNKLPSEKELEKKRAEGKLSPVEIIVETSIFAYGGRKQLETVRSSIQEEGTIRLATDQGDLSGNFTLRGMWREKSWQDLLRVDLELTAQASGGQSNPPPIKYVIGFNGASVWSAQNGQYVTPAPSAERAFRAQLTHEYMALLRYKEDGSKLELVGPETVVGVDTNRVDMTNPNGEKTRYWISTKTYRIVHAEYETKLDDSQPPTKYHIAYFYAPFRVVQNTLVPVRRVMSQDGKFVQEITLGNIVYQAKIDPEVFQHLQEQ